MKLALVSILAVFARVQDDDPKYTWTVGKEDIILKAFAGGPEDAAETVLRSAKEWDDFVKSCSEEVRKSLKETKIDFDKQTVLAVAVGRSYAQLAPHEKEEAGIRGAVEREDRWVVYYNVIRSDAREDQASYPVYLVKTPKSDKKIEFKKRTKYYGE